MQRRRSTSSIRSPTRWKPSSNPATETSAVNRRLCEEVLIRIKKMRPPERTERRVFRDRQRPVEKKESETQWVWLLDENKLEDRGITPPPPAAPEEPPPGRRRRRRRGGMHLPGNRGKHLNE